MKKTEAEVADGRITPALAAEQIAELMSLGESAHLLEQICGMHSSA